MSDYEKLQAFLLNKQSTWLITGVAGFIGSNLLERLLILNQKVVGLDNFETGFQDNIDQAIRDAEKSSGVSLSSNFRFINEHSLNHSDDNLLQELNDFFPATKKDYVDDFSDLNIIIKFHGETASTDCYHKIERICERNNVATVSPELFRLCSDILGKSPSAGFLGVMIALKYYSKVECFGFNFNQNIDVDKHYFEESDKTGGTHDFHQEHKIIKNLHTNNQLSLFI